MITALLADTAGAAVLIATHDDRGALAHSLEHARRPVDCTSRIGLWTWTAAPPRRQIDITTAVGVAAAVALLASLGSFCRLGAGHHDPRAAARSVVDWQVQVQPQAASTAATLTACARHRSFAPPCWPATPTPPASPRRPEHDPDHRARHGAHVPPEYSTLFPKGSGR